MKTYFPESFYHDQKCGIRDVAYPVLLKFASQ